MPDKIKDLFNSILKHYNFESLNYLFIFSINNSVLGKFNAILN